MHDVIIISGSPSEHSRSESALKYIGRLLEQKGISIRHISVRDVPAEDLVTGNYKSPVVSGMAEEIGSAKGVIIGSPVYKASYSGVLKSLLDIMPQDLLQNTPVLPVMSGGSIAHLLALEYALKPLISTLKGVPLKGIYYLDTQVDKGKDQPIIDEGLLNRTEKQVEYLVDKMNIKKSFS